MCENKFDNEYNSLREEIIHSDKFCFTIITSLFTLTTIFYGFILKSDENLLILLPIVTIIWVIGFYYITDKRFVILRIVGFFIKEKQGSTMIWDKWNIHNSGKINDYNINNKSDKSDSITYPRINPYILETCMIIGIMGINFLLTILGFFS